MIRQRSIDLDETALVPKYRRIEGKLPRYVSLAATLATTDTSVTVASELILLLDRFTYGSPSMPIDALFSYQESEESREYHGHKRPHRGLVLTEIIHICDAVWRHGTCAEPNSHHSVGKCTPLSSLVFEDSLHNPEALKIRAPTTSYSDDGRSFDQLFARGNTVINQEPHRVAEGGRQPQKTDIYDILGSGHMSHSSYSSMKGYGDTTVSSCPKAGCASDSRCMHPATSYILTFLGGFTRSKDKKYLFFRKPQYEQYTVDVPCPDEYLENDGGGVFRSTLGEGEPVAVSPLMKLLSLYFACLNVFDAALQPHTPITVVKMAHCDAFGWPKEQNTVNSCIVAIKKIYNEIIEENHKHWDMAGDRAYARDLVVLLWDTMLTDAGIPTIERALYNIVAPPKMFHCFTAHNSYGRGTAILCFEGDNYTVAASVPSIGPSILSRDPSYRLMSSIRSPAKVLCRCRNDAGSCLAVCPSGLEGPVIALFYIKKALFDKGAVSVNRALDTYEMPYFSFLTLAEKQFRHLWWYVHYTAIGAIPFARRRMVLSVGVMQNEEEAFAEAKRDGKTFSMETSTIQRYSTLLRLCSERYHIESECSFPCAMGYRVICNGEGRDTTAGAIEFTDI